MKTKPGKLAVLYARVASADPGDAINIEHQLERCRRWAKDRNLRIDQEFAEYGASGMTLERPGLTHLLGYLETHPVSYVVCREISRLSRNHLLTIEAVTRIQRRGTHVAFALQDEVLEAHLDELPGDTATTEQEQPS